MDVLIYGGGAVGLGLASCLIENGVCPDIVARHETVQALGIHGLARTGLFGHHLAAPGDFHCFTGLDVLPGRDYDFILVCTKSFDSNAAARDLAQHQALFGPNTRIVLFQNGWGNAECFVPFFGEDRVYNARVITGFARPAPHHVNITVHADAIHVGSLFGKDLACLSGLCQVIGRGGIPCETASDIQCDLWAKMLYNCALNPLGALLGVPYGALAQEASTRTIMNAIIKEVFQVMRTAGFQTYWPRAQGFMDVFYERLVPSTAEHLSSTLQDIRAGKPTEVDALNGAVIALAGKHCIEVPYNRFAYHAVKFMETRGQA